MKRKIKGLFLLTLLVIAAVLVFIPAESHASKPIQLPGMWIEKSEYGVTCACPVIFYYNCGCGFTPPVD